MADDLFVLPGVTEWLLKQFRRPNSVTFHYTSRVAFEAILSSRRMWAMDLRTMNDPRELLHGRELIDKRLVKAARKLRGTAEEQWIRTVRQLFNDLVVKRSSTFSISFSEERDLPHQWRDYAAQGTGFVLGWSIDSDYPGIPLKTWVAYDREKQTEVVDGLVDIHLRAMFDGMSPRGAAAQRAWTSAGYSLSRFLNALWLTFKSSDWSDESEFRYVYHVWNDHLPVWCEIKTRPDTGRRYIEADFRPAELKYVGIGPNNDPHSTRQWVDDLLRRNNFHGVHVEHSVVSLG